MKILYICSATTDKMIDKINKNCNKSKPSSASALFDRNILSGMVENGINDVEVLSIINVPSFPKYKKIILKNVSEKYNDIDIRYIPILNIPILKYILISIYLIFNIFTWAIRNFNIAKKCILLSNIESYISLPAVLISRLKNIKSYVIVPDLPGYTINYTKNIGFIKNIFYKLSNYIYDIIKSSFSGYIFLTEYMNLKVNKFDKPYTVIDGLINFRDCMKVADSGVKIDKQYQIIMYAGALSKTSGIDKLINAFINLDKTNVKLWIFGSGDYESEIVEATKINKNIIYYGQVSHDEILKKEKIATLLINVRNSKDEYTKYSFPSKTLEYMASGTPVLTTKLTGISEEYYKYLYLIDDESIEGIKKAIEKVLGISNDELYKFGQKSKEFVEKYKNNTVQTKKILKLIS